MSFKDHNGMLEKRSCSRNGIDDLRLEFNLSLNLRSSLKMWQQLIGCLLFLCLIHYSSFTWAGNSIYCPEGQRYIHIGMTMAEVRRACGEPRSIQNGGRGILERVPTQQFLYFDLNEGYRVYPTLNPIFNQWSLPTGTTRIRLEVNIVNDKVASIKMNGSDTDTVTVCHQGNFQVGDDYSEVIKACGQPQMVNESYTEIPVPRERKPAMWVYQLNQYQPPMTLTFVNGKLQSIDTP